MTATSRQSNRRKAGQVFDMIQIFSLWSRCNARDCMHWRVSNLQLFFSPSLVALLKESHEDEVSGTLEYIQVTVLIGERFQCKISQVNLRDTICSRWKGFCSPYQYPMDQQQYCCGMMSHYFNAPDQIPALELPALKMKQNKPLPTSTVKELNEHLALSSKNTSRLQCQSIRCHSD